MKNQLLFTALFLALFSSALTLAQEKSPKQRKKDSIKAERLKEKYPMKIDTVYGEVMRIIDMTPGSHEGFIQRSKNSIDLVEEQHSLFVSNKKTEFRLMVEKVNKDLSENKITEEQAEEFKVKNAEKLAKLITAHRLKTDADINLIKVNTTSPFFDDAINQDKSSSVGISIEKGISVHVGDNREYQKKILTTSGFTLGFGYNFISGNDLGINDFSYGNNNYFSLGYQWQTVLSENQKWRINYGIAYQSHGTELNGNRIFSPNTDDTDVVDIGFNVDKAKFRQDQLIFPVQLELGGATKKEYEDGRVRYSQWGEWKAGIGGFAGFNLSSRLKLKYDENGRDIKNTIVNAFETNPFVYGIDAYVGKGSTTLFGRMNLNDVFKSGSVDAQYVSFGIRFQ